MAAVDRRDLPRAYRFIAFILRPLLLAGFRRRFTGTEHLPKGQGCVVCVNHLSHIDPLTVSLFLYDGGNPPFFLAKEVLFRLPVIGRLISGAAQIPVYRESGYASDAYRAAVAAVREGRTVVILPEGTLTRDPDLWPMKGKTGAARVALQTRCPVIPVAQWGPQELLAPYAKRLRLLPRKTVSIAAGPPVDLADLYDRPIVDAELLQEATDRIMDAVTTLLEQLRGEPAPAVRFDPREAGVPLTGNPRRAQP